MTIPTCRSRIKTDPSTSGPNNKPNKRITPTNPTSSGEIAAIPPMKPILFIADSDRAAYGAAYRAPRHHAAHL
jgi:hypothetical protein